MRKRRRRREKVEEEEEEEEEMAQAILAQGLEAAVPHLILHLLFEARLALDAAPSIRSTARCRGRTLSRGGSARHASMIRQGSRGSMGVGACHVRSAVCIRASSSGTKRGAPPPRATAAAAKELQQLRDKVRKLEAEPDVSMQSESLTGAAAKQRLNE
eukprot:5574953-Pyramimonas_sp.AAC.1